jgi:hypothetical protein
MSDTGSDDLYSDQQRPVNEFMERFRQALAERPEISDEEFLAETEVSDEEYEQGFGVILSGTRRGGDDQ